MSINFLRKTSRTTHQTGSSAFIKGFIKLHKFPAAHVTSYKADWRPSPPPRLYKTLSISGNECFKAQRWLPVTSPLLLYTVRMSGEMGTHCAPLTNEHNTAAY